MDDLVTLADGRRAQLWAGGADDGPLVLVFHGCPDTRHVAMTGHDAAGAVGVRLLCVNRPGYGASDPYPFTQDSVADDAVAVARAHGNERFAVLGMSVGCGYAHATAARHRDHVAALGMVAPQYPPSEPGTVEEKVAAYRPGFLHHVAQIDPLDTDDGALAARFLARLPAADAALLTRLPAGAVAASVRESLATPDGYLRDAALLHSGWEHLPEEVDRPTYVWFGALDDRSTPEAAEELTCWFDRRAVVVHPETTHLATLLAHWPEILTALSGHLRDWPRWLPRSSRR